MLRLYNIINYITQLCTSLNNSSYDIVESYNTTNEFTELSTIPNNVSFYYNIPLFNNINLSFSSNIIHAHRILLLQSLTKTNSFFYKWLYNNINNKIKFTLINIDAISSLNDNLEFIFINVIYSLPTIKNVIHETVILKNNYNSILFIIKNNSHNKIFPYEASHKYFIILQQYFSISKGKIIINIPSCFYNDSIIPKHIISLIHKYSNFKISNNYNISLDNNITTLLYNTFIFITTIKYPHTNNYHNLYIYIIESDIKHIYTHIQSFNDELYQNYNNRILIKEFTYENLKQLNIEHLNIIYDKIYKLL